MTFRASYLLPFVSSEVETRIRGRFSTSLEANGHSS